MHPGRNMISEVDGSLQTYEGLLYPTSSICYITALQCFDQRAVGKKQGAKQRPV